MSELTVVVPTYNGARHLRSTLDSLYRQSERVSVLVVDDGSRDESAHLAAAHPCAPHVVTQRNLGVAVARNRGLALATTRWVSFLDQDDMWHPLRASQLLTLAAQTHTAAVATTEQAFAVEEDRQQLYAVADGREDWPAHWIRAGQEEALLLLPIAGDDSVEEITLDRLLSAPAMITTAAMYEREAAIAAGGCAPHVRAADDHVLNINFARAFGPIKRLNRPSLFYRVHPESTTTVSPLVAPYLTTLLALRHGRALPSRHVMSEYLEHLLSQLPTQEQLDRVEQIALLVLTVPPSARSRWLLRSLKRAVRTRRSIT